jgi:hypothetical protein
LGNQWRVAQIGCHFQTEIFHAEIHTLLPPCSAICLYNRAEQQIPATYGSVGTTMLHRRSVANKAVLLAVATISTFLFLTAHAQQQFKSPPAAANVTASCVPHERDALLAFKRGITNDTANLLTSSRPGKEEDCCWWIGVTCSDKSGNVITLNLNRETSPSALVGEISPSLLSLEYLEYLDLSTNSLEGQTAVYRILNFQSPISRNSF